ncbi:MAG: single-stranded-DNA-specific exonuclease RecJ [Eubacteriales bacterium]|nr:single-stranded-DNA-specific exonuclease RecJ [Eubacteriales bacterium]
MKNNDWKIPFHAPEIPEELINAGYTPLLSAALALRGVRTKQDARIMTGSDVEIIHDPFLIKGMDKAAARLRKAIENREKTAVYGDYDVDGITSTCIVTDYLRSKGLECMPYIPDRNGEGYGLNCSALDVLHSAGVSLVITVDCGITAVEEAEYAKTIGVDMIITDHHECKDAALPDVAALIDCKQPGDSYPNGNLAGVGMALKLICACEGESREMTERYADLVAIGTVADVMPLVGENRCLVRKGLRQLEDPKRPGIAAMFREACVDTKKITASTVGYSLAPRLNAAGRLGKAATAAKLILSEDGKEASRLASELCELNRRRQSIETEIWEEANALLDGKTPTSPIVLASDRWHQGVIGIAASRLAEQYSLPAVMICLNGDTGKGSCRSFGDFNIFEALSACSEYLTGFGGHALAAGLNIRVEKLEEFKAALSCYYLENRPQKLPEVCCDMLINDPELLSIENVSSLEQLEPYGNMNPRPVMCMYGTHIESLSSVGNGKHLRMRVRLGRSRFECIFFSHNARELGINEGESVDMAFTPQINEFRGHQSVQLVVSAVRPHDPRALCEAILSGDSDSLYGAFRCCPDRDDFVRVWRSLEKKRTVGKTADTLLGDCPKEVKKETYCLCLAVFKETGLLRSGDGRIYGAEAVRIKGKADLDSTVIIRALKEYRRKYGQ